MAGDRLSFEEPCHTFTFVGFQKFQPNFSALTGPLDLSRFPCRSKRLSSPRLQWTPKDDTNNQQRHAVWRARCTVSRWTAIATFAQSKAYLKGWVWTLFWCAEIYLDWSDSTKHCILCRFASILQTTAPCTSCSSVWLICFVDFVCVW